MIIKEKFEFAKVTEKFSVIDKQGNVQNYPLNYCVLMNENSEIVSKNYAYISKIDDDYLIVGDVRADYSFYLNLNINMLSSNLFYGIIKLKRDNEGKIIPFKEEIVTPIMYNRIAIGNNKTAIACYNGGSTYLEFNPESKYFGKQLVPCVLGHVAHFDLQYDGFAECELLRAGKRLYLPRLTIPVSSICYDDLLTEEEVKQTLNMSSGYQKIKNFQKK